MKPKNTFKSQELVRKLETSGLGRIAKVDQFVAPEVTKSQASINFKSDVWSLGAIFFFLRFGRPAFNQPQLSLWDLEEGNLFIQGDGVKISSDEEQLIFRSLQGDPANRISLDDFLKLRAFDAVKGLLRKPTQPAKETIDKKRIILTERLRSVGFPSVLISEHLKDGHMGHVTACVRRMEDEPGQSSLK
jgi:serine/threonine protein kinase